jgi:hypothetical protein
MLLRSSVESTPWLLTGAPPEVIASEIALMAASLLPPNERAAAAGAWIEIVRAGEALRALRASCKQADQDALRESTPSYHLTMKDLVWVGGRFGFPAQDVPREVGVKVEIQFIGQLKRGRFLAAYLVPVREAVQSGALSLPSGSDEVVLRLIDAFIRPTLADSER